MPKKVYDSVFAPAYPLGTTQFHASSPQGIELRIPSNLFPLLNSFPRLLKPF